MSLSSNLSGSIGSMQRLRGEAYDLEVGPTPSGARVAVRGTRPHVVFLDVEADALLCWPSFRIPPIAGSSRSFKTAVTRSCTGSVPAPRGCPTPW